MENLKYYPPAVAGQPVSAPIQILQIKVMKLSELLTYAKEKYHMEEIHPWASEPGISVLDDPETGRHIALLFRQWDTDTGTELQRMDLRCGWINFKKPHPLSLTKPLFMKGSEWVGIIMDEDTSSDMVFTLFDRAAGEPEKKHDSEWNYSIVVDDIPGVQKGADFFRETRIPGSLPQPVQRPAARQKEPSHHEKVFRSASAAPLLLDVPKKILEMQRLYQYMGSSLSAKSENFYIQGKFMEDYVDDVPWEGSFMRYFPTYHDLNTKQLRGYFTWRAQVREGSYKEIPESAAYIYVYELLCGIGADSPRDVLKKLRAFESGFLDTDAGSCCTHMRENLHRWMFDYAVIHELPVEEIRALADPEMLKGDDLLAALKDPAEHTDEELFSALSYYCEKKTMVRSPVITKHEEKGKHLFAAVWRYAAGAYHNGSGDLFTACFGDRDSALWHPLANAVYREDYQPANTDILLDPMRGYHYMDGSWMETRYPPLFFHTDILQTLMRTADRLLRKYLKTGGALHAREDEAWAEPYVRAVIDMDKNTGPEITIDFASLASIREDAAHTRESLLIGEDAAEPDDAENVYLKDSPGRLSFPPSGKAADKKEETSADSVIKEVPSRKEPSDSPNTGSYSEESKRIPSGTSKEQGEGSVTIPGLDEVHCRVLQMLLHDEPVAPLIRSSHLLPSVVTDTINEAMFDMIGDTVLTCTDDKITLVADYREDLQKILDAGVTYPQ